VGQSGAKLTTLPQICCHTTVPSEFLTFNCVNIHSCYKP